ncbi:MAG TPA: photosystem II assembly protein Psb35 [Xenococcaceae cyanobacterium]
MSLLMEVATTGSKFPTYFVAVYVVGFIAAVSIGSIAWYNSKRPAGWENAERPDFVPGMKSEAEAEDTSAKES